MDKESIDELERIASTENEGRGVSCVRAIIVYLRRGQDDLAASIRQVDGDKTYGFPLIESQLYKMFGCRSHGKYDCDEWLCEKLNNT